MRDRSSAATLFLLACLLIPTSSIRAQCMDCDGDGFEWPDDCNDASAVIHAGAPEICDGFDNDCDGLVDNHPACNPSCPLPDKLGQALSVLMGRPSLQNLRSAWTGSSYGLVWSDASSGQNDLYFMLVDPTGLALTAPVPVRDQRSNQVFGSDLVWTGDQFAIVWWDTRTGGSPISLARLDAAGEKLGPDQEISDGPGALPSLAWTGKELGVAWTGYSGAGPSQIRFVRVSRDGALVQAEQLVSTGTGAASEADLLWHEQAYRIAWSMEQGGGNSDLFFSSLDETGNPIMGSVQLTAVPGAAYTPVLASQGSRLAMAWRDSRSGGLQLYFRLMSSSGESLAEDLALTSSPMSPNFFSLGVSGEILAVVWSDGSISQGGVHLKLIDSLGGVQAAISRVSMERQTRSPAIRWDGIGFTLAWIETPAGSVQSARIACDCIDADGDLSTFCQDCDDGNALVFPGAPQLCDGLNNDCRHPTWPLLTGTTESDDDGDGFSECQGDCNDIQGDIWPGAPQICDGLNNDCEDPRWPYISGTNEWDDDQDNYTECEGDCDDSNDLVFPGASQLCDGINNDCDDPAWPEVSADEGDGDGDTFGICQAGCDLRMTTTATIAYCVWCRGASSYPSLAWSGADVGLAWSIYGRSDRFVRFMLLGPDGSRRSGVVEVDWPESSGPEPAPSLVWTGSEYAIAWIRRFRVAFARFSSEGIPLADIREVAFSEEHTLSPALVSTGGGFGLFWEDYRLNRRAEIFFARLDAFGNKIGEDVLISEPMFASRSPSAAWSGELLGVAWSDIRDGNGEIYFALVTPEGSKLSNDIRLTSDAAASLSPKVVWTGTEYGVAWEDTRAGTSQIFFARLDAAGAKIGVDTLLTPAAVNARSPALSWNGNAYAVVWQDERDGNQEIYMRRVDATGSPLWPETRLTDHSSFSVLPAIAWIGSNHAIAWSDGRDDPIGEVYYRRALCEDCDDTRADVHPGALEYCDGLDNDCDATIDLACINRNPVAVAGGDRQLACSARLTPVELDGRGSTDPDGHMLSYRWTGPFPEGGGQVDGALASVSLPVGESSVQLEVEDELGGRGEDSVLVQVQDLTPPSLELAPAPGLLWPPNHRLVPVEVGVLAVDACGDAGFVLEGVTSSEPDDAPGLGDGRTTDDIQDVQAGAPDQNFLLRSERDGGGTGRIYTATYRAADEWGNTSVAGTIFLVPHDVGGLTEPMVLTVVQEGATARVTWQPVATADRYDVIRGDLASLRETATAFELGPLTCLASSPEAGEAGAVADGDLPAAGSAFFYLAQYRAGLLTSGYGTATAAKPRAAAVAAGACP